MLENDGIDVSEGIGSKKAGDFQQCVIWHYSYFLSINLRFQLKVWNACHWMTQKSMNFNNIAIVTIEGDNYRVHFWFMTKIQGVDRSKNAVQN